MDNADDAIQIILQKGIGGSFDLPRPYAKYTIIRSPRSPLVGVWVSTRRPGTRDLVLTVKHFLLVEDHVESLSRLQEILDQIPVQHVGVEDIYGRDTSIVKVTDPLHEYLRISTSWPGLPGPTEEQTALFDEAVRIIEQLGVPTE